MQQQPRRLAKNSELRFAIDNFMMTAGACCAMDPDHQDCVANLACAIGRELGLSSHQLTGLRVSALLHDIGLQRVPKEILSKPGALTPEEMAAIHEHPQVGYQFLSHVDFPWPVAEIVLKHHEHFDGSGYPHKLSGADIPIEASILCVADMVEAMVTDRPHRSAVSVIEAAAEVEKHCGSYYQPEVVEAFLKLVHGRELSVRGWAQHHH